MLSSLPSLHFGRRRCYVQHIYIDDPWFWFDLNKKIKNALGTLNSRAKGPPRKNLARDVKLYFRTEIEDKLHKDRLERAIRILKQDTQVLQSGFMVKRAFESALERSRRQQKKSGGGGNVQEA